jgi:hypothetical protein
VPPLGAARSVKAGHKTKDEGESKCRDMLRLA